MRSAIARLVRPGEDRPDELLPTHVGLAYDVWAPVDCATNDPKIRDARRHHWLAAVAGICAPKDYSTAFERWRDSLNDPFTVTATVTLASRMLIGHGNPSPTEVGLTLHHTWGVPIIPGSALKGLLAHYIDAAYGEDETWQGVGFDGGRPSKPPGQGYRELFGAPDTGDGDEPERQALQGAVIFHDALWDPRSRDCKPLAADVLTVHQKKYYDQKGASWPNDYDSPNPVAYLTVAPDARFLVAVTCADEAWRDLAFEELLQALKEWGVGGKTSAGYGRILDNRPRPAPTPETTELVEAIKDKSRQLGARLDLVRDALPEVVNWPQGQRALVRDALKVLPDNKRTKERLAILRKALDSGVLPPPTPLEAFRAGLERLPADIDVLLDQLDALKELWEALGPEDRPTAKRAVEEHFAGCERDVVQLVLEDLK